MFYLTDFCKSLLALITFPKVENQRFPAPCEFGRRAGRVPERTELTRHACSSCSRTTHTRFSEFVEPKAPASLPVVGQEPQSANGGLIHVQNPARVLRNALAQDRQRAHRHPCNGVVIRATPNCASCRLRSAGTSCSPAPWKLHSNTPASTRALWFFTIATCPVSTGAMPSALWSNQSIRSSSSCCLQP